jgi:hypothetical protein
VQLYGVQGSLPKLSMVEVLLINEVEND